MKKHQLLMVLRCLLMFADHAQSPDGAVHCHGHLFRLTEMMSLTGSVEEKLKYLGKIDGTFGKFNGKTNIKKEKYIEYILVR